MDEAIVKAVEGGKRKFLDIVKDVFGEASRVLGEPDAGPMHHGGMSMTPQYRLVDRRIQSIRKTGRLSYGGQKEGWKLA